MYYEAPIYRVPISKTPIHEHPIYKRPFFKSRALYIPAVWKAALCSLCRYAKTILH